MYTGVATFDGNTTTLGAPRMQTQDVAYFASAGNVLLVRNQNVVVQGEYKIEVLA